MQSCDSTVRTVDRYTIDRYTIDRYTVDRYTLYILCTYPYTVHTTHLLYTVRTMYFVCSPESDFTSVRHSYSHT